MVRSKAARRTAKLVRIALFTALIAAGAFVKFPIGIVPVSMQMAMCILCCLTLGPWDSLAAVAIYIAMGLVGIPIFTAGGGFAYVLQPTFGYLLGYIIALPIGGMIARGAKNNARPNVWRMLLGAFAAMAVVYTLGVVYMYLILNYYVGSAITWARAWTVGAAVFLPTDCCWCVVCALAARRIVPVIAKGNWAMKGLPKSVLAAEYSRV